MGTHTTLNTTTRMMLTAVLSLLSVRMWADPAATVTQIDVKDATYTDAVAINNRGDIVGSFADGHGQHGYILRGGTFTTLDVPLEGVSQTVAKGINDRGQVAGFYVKSGSDIHGFVWDGGSFTTIDVRGAEITYLHGINNRGQVVGHSRQRLFDLAQGFVWTSGEFTFIDDIPGVLIVGQRTETMAINDGGQVVGSFQSGGVDHGFLFGGRDVTRIDVPSSMAIASRATGINNRGEIVGSFRDASNKERGFLRDKNGSITVIDAPLVSSIAAVGINDRSEIVGLFTIGADFHGFLYAPSVATSSRR